LGHSHHDEKIAHKSAQAEKFGTSINEFQIVLLSPAPWEAGTKFHIYNCPTSCDKGSKKPHNEEDADATRGAKNTAWGGIYSVEQSGQR
jgi:hypothetical protein